MQYRRAFIPGGSYFFTVVTENRRPVFNNTAMVEVLRDAFRNVRKSRPFEIDAMVVMPDHLHCLWTLPSGDNDYATRWRLIKTGFTKHCDPALRQYRYWEHMIRDETDFQPHVDYIHYIPVKHRLALSPIDWPYSSFRRYVEAGIYPPDWGRDGIDLEGVDHE